MLMEQQWWLDRSSLACGVYQVSYLCKFCLLGKYDWGCWNNGADLSGSLMRCISFAAMMNDSYVFVVITLITFPILPHTRYCSMSHSHWHADIEWFSHLKN